MMMKLLLLLVILVSNSWAMATVSAKWEFSKDKSTKRAVEIKVDKQVFKVEGEWLDSEDELEVEKLDLNDDKENDYAVTIKRGVANRYVLYLLKHKQKNTFVSLGVRPELSRVKGEKCWAGMEKDAGLAKTISVSVQDDKFVSCP
jgi:hypothetical protein